MNHVTRGLGATSGMLATGGLGRRILVYVELIAQYAAAASRLWAAHPASRPWSVGATRVWDAIVAARSWVRGVSSRTWTTFTDSRSWLVNKLRTWSHDGH